MPSFRDHFAFAAGSYASFRPSYPDALFQWLATTTRRRDRAWDCGTGSGQAAAALAGLYGDVVATDPSLLQLASAVRVTGVCYAAMTAEASALAEGSVDLITVAQALHWFDRPHFFEEVDRVLARGGALAVWSYGLLTLGDDVDPVLRHLYEEVLGPYWPVERALVDRGYAGVTLPYDEEPSPAFTMEAAWSRGQLLGYLSTWSAVGRYRALKGSDPLLELEPILQAVWGAEEVRHVHWPLTVRVARRMV